MQNENPPLGRRKFFQYVPFPFCYYCLSAKGLKRFKTDLKPTEQKMFGEMTDQTLEVQAGDGGIEGTFSQREYFLNSPLRLL